MDVEAFRLDVSPTPWPLVKVSSEVRTLCDWRDSLWNQSGNLQRTSWRMLST
jgi:hypothetical protein